MKHTGSESVLQKTAWEWETIQSEQKLAERIAGLLSYLSVLEIVFPKLRTIALHQKHKASQLNKKAEGLRLSFPETKYKNEWTELLESYKALRNSDQIWLVLRSYATQRIEKRTPASIDRVRREVVIEQKNIPFIINEQCVYLPGIDGYSFYIYESCVIICGYSELQMVSYTAVSSGIERIEYVEEDKIPADTKILRYTFEKANLDGTMDKRFRENRQIPIVSYALFTIGYGGKNSKYLISNEKCAMRFYEAFTRYRSLMLQREKVGLNTPLSAP